MAQSHYFSIYLLKTDCSTASALRDDHALIPDIEAEHLPEGAALLLADERPRHVWWKTYFGIDRDLRQAFKGALVFVPAAGRTFAFSFGRAYHSLRSGSYEPDFGLRVTLNVVDPQKIKNTDIIEPVNARRQRTQVSVMSDLTFFDFDHDSAVLKNLAGKARDDYAHLVRNVSGQDSLRVSSDVQAGDLPTLCEQLLSLYESNDYESAFPGIRAISRVQDPELVEQLDERLIVGLKKRDSALLLGVPAFVDYGKSVQIRYRGAGGAFVQDDATLELYYEYLSTQSVPLESITLDDLRRHKIELVDEEMRPGDRYSIMKALIYDTQLKGDSAGYHLLENVWYRVETDYMKLLETDLAGMFEDPELPAYKHENEGDYNEKMDEEHDNVKCLDGKNIAPPGTTQVEPCDLLCIGGEAESERRDVRLVHVKRSTRSSGLSHLFSQGAGSMELLLSESASVEKLEALVTDFQDAVGDLELPKRLEKRAVKVVFAVVTKKDPGGRWGNLPLFSRINLRRAKRQFGLMGVAVGIGFIKDES
ncbi:DUF6119 family protein [Candidatus Palauibacter sp.]|uniref:DUF6119 family protein n=1 Tax=Candidatus Palauibacter sp. TaxID=3101350 RepID=UPI003B02CE9A